MLLIRTYEAQVWEYRKRIQICIDPAHKPEVFNTLDEWCSEKLNRQGEGIEWKLIRDTVIDDE